MGKEHQHTATKVTTERYLIIALILTSTFLIAEVVGGIITSSLALISDAAHMLTDVVALVIALMAIRIAKRSSDLRRTFGYYRFEILAAAFNTILLFLVAIYIIYEAYERLYQPPEISSMGMLVIAAIGLIVNIISMRLLMSGKEKSLNIKSAYLEVWSDMLGSIGVIIGAIIIRFTGWAFVDSIIAVLIGLWVLPRTWVLLKESINVLLEGVPEGLDLTQIKQACYKIQGVLDIHDLHVWAITSDKINLTAHVIVDSQYNFEDIFANLRKLLKAQFNIEHTTLQYETKKCLDDSNTCNFILTNK